MVSYLVLGIALLLGLLLLGRWFATADPKDIFKLLKWTSFVLAVAVIAFLAVTGRLVWTRMGMDADKQVSTRVRSPCGARKGKNSVDGQNVLQP